MHDLISRAAAIRKLQDKGKEPRYQHTVEDWKCGLFIAEDIINDLPTAEKVGKWIEVENKWGGLEIRCSECGAQVPRDGWGNAMQCNYCPNCGARLIGEEE